MMLKCPPEGMGFVVEKMRVLALIISDMRVIYSHIVSL